MLAAPVLSGVLYYKTTLHEISGSQGGEYDYVCHVGCCTM
jgi:hypothetical protein